MKKVLVIGNGAWGNALGKLAQKNNYLVSFWSRKDGISILLNQVLDCDVAICAIAMRGVRTLISELKKVEVPSRVIFISATKGLEPDSGKTPYQLWSEAFSNNYICVLSGANLACEIQKELPAATMVAGTDPTVLKLVQNIFNSSNFRVFTSLDLIGVELGGILKNVVAIGAGISDGLELGMNAKAAIISQGFNEIICLGTSWGANPNSFVSFSGLADLITTCSENSRNYQFGFQLSKHNCIKQLKQEIGTVEGLYTVGIATKKARDNQIYLPLFEQINSIVQNNRTPLTIKDEFLNLDQKTFLPQL